MLMNFLLDQSMLFYQVLCFDWIKDCYYCFVFDEGVW